jgi:hypothetical protein
LFDDAARAAKMPVIVVPILEPSISGNTLSRLIRPILTRGTNELVNTDELWTKMVKPQPN